MTCYVPLEESGEIRLEPLRRGADASGLQEFSIEIPDKDADTIHSGKYFLQPGPAAWLRCHLGNPYRRIFAW